jgi:preprotein translocase subunit YajC
MSLHFLAQVSNAASSAAATTTADSTTAASSGAGFGTYLFLPVMLALFYFLMIRPQTQAKKKQEETIKSAKTGDKIITTGGIHGVITNVKDTTVIVKVADNVKLEIEKVHLDKVTRPDAVELEKKVVKA